jgi:hypothetical protein
MNKNNLIAIILIELIALYAVILYYNTLPPVLNEIPMAHAFSAQTVWAGSTVQLDGSSSEDPEGLDLSYNWTLVDTPTGSAASISDHNIVNPTFIADQAGSYHVQLIVGDSQGYSIPSKVIIEAKAWFEDVAHESRVSWGAAPGEDVRGSQWLGPGAAWGDYDNDGDPDLYVPYNGLRFAMRHFLYRNNGDGTFTNVAADAGVAYPGNTFGVAWADYDNDGDLDIYLANYGNASTIDSPGEPNVLYRNNGDGTFTDVTVETGVGDDKHGIHVSWGDYDKDGYLDIFVANRGIPSAWYRSYVNETSVLYHANGDGTFTDVAEELNITQGTTGLFPFSKGVPVISGNWWASIWFDYNKDGYPDLFVCSDFGVSLLYRNNGDGTFTDVTMEAGMFIYGSGMGADVGDYDNDGDLDIYVNNYGAGLSELFKTGADVDNYLWRNNGDGTFTQASFDVGVSGYGGVSMASAFADFDNDGDLDIYVTYGAVGWKAMAKTIREAFSKNIFFLNNGDGTYTEVTGMTGLGIDTISQGLALADYDGDGDIDIYNVNSDDLNNLFRNDYANSLDNNWINIKLNGTFSNRNGIGAWVKVTSGELVQWRYVISGSHYESCSDLVTSVLHYGLEKQAIVDEIEVWWPSDILQTITDISVNQTIEITESAD